MKTRLANTLKLSLGVWALASLLGCSSQTSGPPVTRTVTPAPPPTAVPATNLAAARPQVAAPKTTLPALTEPVAAKTNVVPPPEVAVVKTNATAAAEPAVRKVPADRMVLPAGVDEIVDLAQSRVGDAVLLEYIKNSTNAYELTVDQIVYLNDLGLSEAVLAAMIRHGNQLREQAAAPTPAAPAEASPPPAVAEAPPPAPAPPPAQAAPAPAAAGTEYVYNSPPPAVTYNYFYQTLSPYGNWVELPDYGWAWQPTCAVVDVGWRPYADRGHWIYSTCGWYWASDYSWGWAPFHYGRWHRHHRYGWMWTPGSVWGPAWVAWRQGDLHCGWAPLPPEAVWHGGVGFTYRGSGVSIGFGFNLGWDDFIFVHYRHLNDRDWHGHRLGRAEVTKVYNNSTTINNYIVGNNNTIINNGVPPAKVTAFTRTEVRKVELRDVTPAPGSVPRPGRVDHQTTTLAVYRPSVPPTLTVPAAGSAQPPVLASRRSQEIQKGAPRIFTTERAPATGSLSGTQVTPARVPALANTTTQTSPRFTRSGSEVPKTTVSGMPPSTTRPSLSGRGVTPLASPSPVPTRATPQPAAPQTGSRSVPTPDLSRRQAAPNAPATPGNFYQRSAPAPTPSRPQPQPESYRSEPRKLETLSPSYAPPKFANSAASAPNYAPAAPSGAPAAPARGSYPAPSMAPRQGYAPPPSSAPAYSAPRYASPPPSSPPSYSAPPRSQPASPSSSPPLDTRRGGSRPQQN